MGGERAASAPAPLLRWSARTHSLETRCRDRHASRGGGRGAGGGTQRGSRAVRPRGVPQPSDRVKGGVLGCDSSRPRRPRPRRPSGAPEQAVGPVEGLTPPPLAPPRAHKKKAKIPDIPQIGPPGVSSTAKGLQAPVLPHLGGVAVRFTAFSPSACSFTAFWPTAPKKPQHPGHPPPVSPRSNASSPGTPAQNPVAAVCTRPAGGGRKCGKSERHSPQMR